MEEPEFTPTPVDSFRKARLHARKAFDELARLLEAHPDLPTPSRSHADNARHRLCAAYMELNVAVWELRPR